MVFTSELRGGWRGGSLYRNHGPAGSAGQWCPHCAAGVRDLRSFGIATPYPAAREALEEWMRYPPSSTLAVAALASLAIACGSEDARTGDASSSDAPRGDFPLPADARRGLPLGEGRPDVSGITRTTIRDDERAAVTRVHFVPGAAEPLHTHDFDLLVVPLTAGRVEWLFGEERIDFLDVGEVQFVPAGVVHQLVNAGDAPFEVIAVAIKHE
jgi:quercetin dioxygenase-like cupin family protein